MDMMQFDQYLAKYPKISPVTKQAYKQDLQDFFVMLSHKNKELIQIEPADIGEYVSEIIQKTVSYAYGIRKVAAIKLVIKFIQDNSGRDLTNAISNVSIARFPVFCTNEHIKTVLAQYTHVTSSKDLRDKLILVLLYRYGLSVNKLIQAQCEKTPTHSYSTRIRFTDQSEPLELKTEDHKLLISYMTTQEPTSFLSGKTYIFSIQHGPIIKPISPNALWSIIKKMCAPLRKLPANQVYYDPENRAYESHRSIYLERHPRG